MDSSFHSSLVGSQGHVHLWNAHPRPDSAALASTAPSHFNDDHLASAKQVQFVGGKIVLKKQQHSKLDSSVALSKAPTLTRAAQEASNRQIASLSTCVQSPSLDTDTDSSDSVLFILDHPHRSSLGTNRPSDNSDSFAAPKMTAHRNTRRSQWPSVDQVKYNPLNHPETEEYRRAVAPRKISDIASNEADFGDNGVVLSSKQVIHVNDGPPVKWDGTWEPPPIDWDERPLFVDAHVMDRISEWQKRSTEAFNSPVVDHINEAPGEIALHSWHRPTLDGVAIEAWWLEHMKNPDVCSDVPAWWHRFITPLRTKYHLAPLAHPQSKLDDSDNDMYKVKIACSQLSLLDTINKKLQAMEGTRVTRRQHVAETRPVREPVQFVRASPAHPYAPGINMYLRPAEESDVPQITAIYNHWITNGIACPEMEPLRYSEIRERLRNAKEAKLPFIVAVSRSPKGHRRIGMQAIQSPSEKDCIVGFAFADDYNDIRGMYRYTVEVELFVDSGYLRKGLGRCLLDKMLSCLDLDYNNRGGYDFESEDLAYRAGGKRCLCSVIVSMPYGKGNWEQVKWKFDWLQKFGFKKAGELTEIGRKNNTLVSLVLLQRTTSDTVAPYAP